MRMRRSARSAAALVAALLVGLVPSAAAQAAPGDLDPTFSGDGKQTTDFGHFGDGAGGVALQGDGKIVAVGGTGGGDFALARYDPTGLLDPSFSGDGKQTTDFSGQFSDVASELAIQPDGKIVVVGRGGVEGSNFALARYNPNGSLDTSFSGNGRQQTNFGGYDGANGVALQGDGKIVAVGFASLGGDFGLARYNPNGSLDTSFSGNGRQTTDFGASADGASSVAIQGDGKIVAVGCACFDDPSARDFALARYNPNGALDASFSNDGKLTTDFGASEDAAGAVALQTDGKIVAVGGGGPGGDFALARYLGG
jgi:uncharacterized delta-60 repeat protein